MKIEAKSKYRPAVEKFLFSSCLLLLISIGSGCENNDDRNLEGFDRTPVEYFSESIDYHFEIVALPLRERPNSNYSVTYANDSSFAKDSNGVKLFEYNGEYYYHPVDILNRCHAYLAAYYSTGEEQYLDRAKTFVHRLLIEADEYNNAIYYPYHFDYNLHGLPEAELKAPWYSGLAQGSALGVLSRLFMFTNDSTYLRAANKTFYSLLHLNGAGHPWVAFIDNTGCYWIDEYPLWQPSRTLNGFIYAVFGLYDYQQLTQDSKAEKVIKDCFKTLKNYIPLFRRKGQPSFYGLQYQYFTADYHPTHIYQLRMLGKMTGDNFFYDWADSLYSDYSG